MSGLKSSQSDIREASCREIIRLYSGLILRISRSLTSRAELADDMFQEAFLRLFLKIRLLKEPKAFPGFFRSIILSTAYDVLRKESKHPVESITPDQLAKTLDERFMDHLTLLTYLQRLKKIDRLVIELSFFYGWSDKEISNRIGSVGSGAVRARRSRTLSLLKRWIKSDAKALKAMTL